MSLTKPSRDFEHRSSKRNLKTSTRQRSPASSQEQQPGSHADEDDAHRSFHRGLGSGERPADGIMGKKKRHRTVPSQRYTYCDDDNEAVEPRGGVSWQRNCQDASVEGDRFGFVMLAR